MHRQLGPPLPPPKKRNLKIKQQNKKYLDITLVLISYITAIPSNNVDNLGTSQI